MVIRRNGLHEVDEGYMTCLCGLVQYSHTDSMTCRDGLSATA